MENSLETIIVSGLWWVMIIIVGAALLEVKSFLVKRFSMGEGVWIAALIGVVIGLLLFGGTWEEWKAEAYERDKTELDVIAFYVLASITALILSFKAYRWVRLNNLRKAPLTLIVIAFLYSGFPVEAEVKKTCLVSYYTSQGISKDYLVDIVFMTGTELNKATLTFDYDTLSSYASIWFGPGKVAAIKIDRVMIGNFGVFDNERFKREFRFDSSFTGKDQDGRKWRVNTKSGLRFIDDLVTSSTPLSRVKPEEANNFQSESELKGSGSITSRLRVRREERRNNRRQRLGISTHPRR